MKKWIWVIILAIVGILAAIVAIEYLTVSIGHLPSFIPGRKAKAHGHYHKRGAIAALIAVIAFGYAIFLAIRIRREATGGPARGTAVGASSSDILSSDTPQTPSE
jgi:hypothetical protein